MCRMFLLIREQVDREQVREVREIIGETVSIDNDVF